MGQIPRLLCTTPNFISRDVVTASKILNKGPRLQFQKRSAGMQVEAVAEKEMIPQQRYSRPRKFIYFNFIQYVLHILLNLCGRSEGENVAALPPSCRGAMQ